MKSFRYVISSAWLLIMYRIFVLYKLIHSQLFKPTTMGLEAKIASLAVAQIDFQNDELEIGFEGVLTSFGELFRISLELDKANESDTSVESVAGGVLELANQFGVVFKKLTSDQADAVRNAVADVVTGANETLIESFFNAALSYIEKQQAMNAAVDAATDTPTE